MLGVDRDCDGHGLRCTGLQALARRWQLFCRAKLAVMMRRETLVLVLLSPCAFPGNACSSSGSPTAPAVPPADFAAQFDSLWSTFDREYSYFDYKRIDWNALRATFRPRAIAATDRTGFIGIIREMLGHLRDGHVVVRDPAGAAVATYDPQRFVNWDRSVWRQYIGRANWTEWQSRDPVLDWALNARP